MAGRFVVPALLEAGYSVRGQYVRAPADIPGVGWMRWDFMESLAVAPLVEGCDAVVHLAAQLSDTAKMHRLNVDATRALASAAHGAGVRYFGHASSIVVYGSPRSRTVDERTPLLDPSKPTPRQYHAEPYMLEYARTKTLGELALRELAPAMRVDLLRPAVVADLDRILESASWSFARKVFALYRQTQYIYSKDAAAAIVHLLTRGLKDVSNGIEAYNICDETSGSFRELYARAHEITGEPCFKAPLELPVVADMAKDFVRSPSFGIRYPLGMLRLSNAKLRATGFRFPTGFDAALELALAHRLKARGEGGPASAGRS
jgi:nucleoside-diphosphate-sugar epimerase